MEKKTCVITGATSGIGYGIAKGLAAKNFDLILIGRDPEKGKAAVASLRNQTSDQLITYYNTDLCSQKMIRNTGEDIKNRHPKIDILINNAGVWTSRYELTDDKVEKQFAVNHLAYFFTHPYSVSQRGKIGRRKNYQHRIRFP